MMPKDRPEQPPENRGIEATSMEPTPLPEMLDRLKAAGLPDAQDRLFRWRKAGLIGKTIPSGDGNARRIAPLDGARLYVIARLHVEFERQKIPDDELAFWLAAAGGRGLVMDGIVRGTSRYLRGMMGLLGKRVGGRWFLDEPNRDTVTRVSGSLTHTLKRMFRETIDVAASLAMKAMLSAFLTQLLNPTTEAGVVKNIGIVLRRIGATDAQAAEWTPHVWRGLREFSTFFIEGERNAFVAAANACRNISSEEAMRTAHHAYLMYGMLLRVLPELKPFKPARVMVPMLAGMLLHVRDNEASKTLRKRIDDEGDVALQEAMQQMIDLRQVFMARFF